MQSTSDTVGDAGGATVSDAVSDAAYDAESS